MSTYDSDSDSATAPVVVTATATSDPVDPAQKESFSYAVNCDPRNRLAVIYSEIFTDFVNAGQDVFVSFASEDHTGSSVRQRQAAWNRYIHGVVQASRRAFEEIVIDYEEIPGLEGEDIRELFTQFDPARTEDTLQDTAVAFTIKRGEVEGHAG